MAQIMDESNFPKDLIKNLGDRSQEKRAIAAKQIEDIAKKIILDFYDEYNQIDGLIKFFTEKYINNQENNIHKKKGGFKALSSIAIAISTHDQIAKKYVIKITNPMIVEFSDNNNKSKCKFEAMEALFFVSMSFQSIILLNFNNIFDKLIQQFSQVDEPQEFKKAAQSLEGLLKQIIGSALPETPHFNFKKFMPILCSKTKAKHPFIRRALLGWIVTFDEIPGLDLLDYLPDFLEDLFNMLEDQNGDIFKQAQKIVREFLNEIKERENKENYMNDQIMDEEYSEGNLIGSQKQKVDIHPAILDLLLNLLGKKEKKTSIIKKRALEWIQEYLKLYLDNLAYYRQQSLENRNPSNENEFIRRGESVHKQGSNNMVRNDKLGRAIVNKISQIIVFTLNCLSHDQEEIRKTASNTNDLLFKIIEHIQHTEIDVEEIMSQLNSLLMARRGSSIAENCLTWMGHMLVNNKHEVYQSIEDILQTLIDMLYRGEFSQSVLDVLGKLALNEKYFDKVIEKILNVMYNSKEQLQKNCDLIVKKLCSGEQDSKKVFQTIANKLSHYEDNQFVATFVQSLDTILLTDRQLEDLRTLLRNMKYDGEKQEKSEQLFEKLFYTWCYNPVSTITLCFLGQQYELAFRVINCFQDIEIDTEILVQISKLINFLESTHFVYLRLSLLQHQKYPYLMKSLLGLLMLIPQGKAFQILNQRLKTAQMENSNHYQIPVKEEDKTKNHLNIEKLLNIFQTRQKYLQSTPEIRPQKTSSFNTNSTQLNLV